MGDWLGTNAIAPQKRKYKPFKEARKYARKLRLSSGREWKEFCKKGKLPIDIPAQPDWVYRENGWINLAGLLSDEDRNGRRVDVLNGIAFDGLNQRIFVTGKWWPVLYEIKIVEL